MKHLSSLGATYDRSDDCESLPDVVPPEATWRLSVNAVHFLFDELGTFLGVYSETTARFNPLEALKALAVPWTRSSGAE